MENIKQFTVHLKDNGDIEYVYVFFDDGVPPFIQTEEEQGNTLNRFDRERHCVNFLATIITKIREHRVLNAPTET